MTKATFDAEAWIDVAAPALGLIIAPEFRPGVAMNLRRMAEVAQFVMDFPLDDEAEPAPVYKP